MAGRARRLSAERLREWARVGAETILKQLRAEIASIVRMFPQLEQGSAVSPPAPVETLKRRRHRISAVGRRAIAAAQRARWAKIKKAKPGRRKRGGMSATARKAASERMKKYWAGRRKSKVR